MTPINAGLHRILDFVTVAGFALAPTLFGLVGAPATLAYVLAVVHLLLTLATRYHLQGRGLVPFPFHGIIEFVVTVALLLLPFLVGWTDNARMFYLGTAAVFAVVWTLTDYKPKA